MVQKLEVANEKSVVEDYFQDVYILLKGVEMTHELHRPPTDNILDLH